jgi:ABC-type dipeptide/oligopeptide/nickel transport system permease component
VADVDRMTQVELAQQELSAPAAPAPARSFAAPWLGVRARRVRYVASRLAQGVVIVFGALTVSFVLAHLSGNPAEVFAGGMMSREQVQQLSHQLGYDRPLSVQYVDYIGHAVRGNLGRSFRFEEPAIRPVLHALPRTLVLVVGAILVSSALALPAAMLSVLRRESLADRAVRRFLMLLQGFPEYWLGLVLVLLFSVQLKWLPSLGNSGFKSVILPVVTLALPLVPILMRLLRGNLLDIFASDFVVALKGKGLSSREILLRHGLRNASVPFLTFLGLQIGWLISGTIIVENIFAWPGIGLLSLSAVQARDVTVIQTIVVVVAVSFVLLNLAVDLLVMAIDPRIRIGR